MRRTVAEALSTRSSALDSTSSASSVSAAGLGTPTLGIYPDDPPATPNYSARVDDFYVGARAHFWPCRWFRMSFAVGDVVHRERDRDLSPPTKGEVSSDGTLRANQLFWQTQFAVPVVHVERWQLEIAVDLGSAPTEGLEAALGLGIRL